MVMWERVVAAVAGYAVGVQRQIVLSPRPRCAPGLEPWCMRFVGCHQEQCEVAATVGSRSVCGKVVVLAVKVVRVAILEAEVVAAAAGGGSSTLVRSKRSSGVALV